MVNYDYDGLWSSDWKELGRRACAGQHGSDDWLQAQSVMDTRVGEAMQTTADATRLLAWMTLALAVMTGVLAIVTVAQG